MLLQALSFCLCSDSSVICQVEQALADLAESHDGEFAAGIGAFLSFGEGIVRIQHLAQVVAGLQRGLLAQIIQV